MNNLQIITIKNGIQAVSALELYSFLEPKTEFRHWIKRMLKYGFEENQDYLKINNGETCTPKMTDTKDFRSKMTETSIGRPVDDYVLTLDCAKSIAMVQRSLKGKEVRKYFLECERKSKALEAHANALLLRELNNYRRMEQIRIERNRLNREARAIHQDMIHIEVAQTATNQLTLIFN